MHDTTELSRYFTELELMQLRQARRLPVKYRNDLDRSLLRRYWRVSRARSRAGYTKLDNGRVNQDYHTWLREQGLPDMFDPITWRKFQRACRHGTIRGG